MRRFAQIHATSDVDQHDDNMAGDQECWPAESSHAARKRWHSRSNSSSFGASSTGSDSNNHSRSLRSSASPKMRSAPRRRRRSRDILVFICLLAALVLLSTPALAQDSSSDAAQATGASTGDSGTGTGTGTGSGGSGTGGDSGGSGSSATPAPSPSATQSASLNDPGPSQGAGGSGSGTGSGGSGGTGSSGSGKGSGSGAGSGGSGGSVATSNTPAQNTPAASATQASSVAAGSGNGGAASASNSGGAPAASATGSTSSASGSTGATSSGGMTVSANGTVTAANGTVIANGTASAGGAAASVVPYTIPALDFSNDAVPFLLQRPIAWLLAARAGMPGLRSVDTTAGAQRRLTADAYFTACGDAPSAVVEPERRINISAVYAHLDTALRSDVAHEGLLKIVAVGAIDANTSAAYNGIISSVQTQTRFLTMPVATKLESICDRLYPTAPDYAHPLLGQYQSCDYGPGDVAFGVSVPLNSSYALGTLVTQIRISDSSTPPLTVACLNVQVSPYYPDAWYWDLMRYLPVALAAAFFAFAAAARVSTAISMRRQAFKGKARPGGAPMFVKDKLAPTVTAALSGEPVVRSPALLRFVTPSCWDVILYVQFVSILAMIAVQWPEFAYPFFKQAAWASLLGPVTLVQHDGAAGLQDPLGTEAYLPSGDAAAIAQQIAANSSSPLFVDRTTPNVFLNLQGAANGIDAYAQMIGLSQQDVFGTTTAIWLLLVAAVLVISAAVWLADSVWAAVVRERARREALAESGLEPAEEKYGDVLHPVDAVKLRMRSILGLHGSAFYGNCVRLLYLFHLPLTAVSVYHFSNADEHGTGSVVLAALSFAGLCVFAPALVLWRIAQHSTMDLFSDQRLLLAVGPLYNYYHPGSQLFPAVNFVHSLALGIVVGGGQASGSAQAIIFLLLEVLLAVAYVLWLPWSDGSIMAPLSFVWSVSRITTAVLVLLLSAVVGLSAQAREWITYVILLLQALIIVGFLLLLAAKLIEAVIRIAYKVTFDERLSHRNGGIGGALRRVRRRKYKALHGSKSRPRVDTRHSSTASMNKLMLTHSPQATPMRGSDVTGTPVGGTANTASFFSERDFGTYSAYLRADAHEEGTIMSALPPLLSSSPPLEQQAGFVRLAGGRATDDQPYRMPSDNAYSQPNGLFGRTTPSQQFEQHLQRPPHQVGWAPNSGNTAERQKRSRRAFWRRGAISDTDSSDDDDVDQWGAGGELQTRQWAGLAKISAALRGLKSKHDDADAADIPVQSPMAEALEPETGERGFAVVRPKRSVPALDVPVAATARTSTESLKPAGPQEQHARYLPAPSESHDSEHDDAAAHEENFWLAPEIAAATKAAKPPPKEPLLAPVAGSPPGPMSAADMYASASATGSTRSRYAEPQSAEILVHPDA